MRRVEYGSRFKANVALEAAGNSSIPDLSKKYSIPVAEIERWVQHLHEHAELIFVGQQTDNHVEAIQNHVALLQKIFEAAPYGILVTDLERKAITYNQKCLEIWDIPEFIVTLDSIDRATEYVLDRVKYPEAVKAKINQQRILVTKTFNDTVELKNGRFVERYSVPYRVDGKIMGRINHFIDVTEYKRTEEKLSRYGNLLYSINANVNEGILRSTPDKGLIYVNDAFVELFGYDSKEEVLATDPTEFYVKKSDRKNLLGRLQKDAFYKNQEVLFKRKDGSTFWGFENSSLVKNEGEIFIDGVITNIDEKKKAEQELRKSEEKYRAILKNIEEGYFEMNLAGNFTFFNGKLVDLLRYPAEAMYGMNNREYMDEENAKKVFQTFNRIFKTGIPEHQFDWEITCGDGTKIVVEASVSLRKDSEDNVVGFSGILRDITERKEKQQHIRQSLKEKEVLLGEIHHRVKNNLAVISGLLYLQADKTDDSNAYRALIESQSRINSMALIHELLYDNHTFSSLDPHTYIEQLVEHITSNFNTGEAKVVTNIEAESFDLEMSTAIPCALIINELLTNAFKYAFNATDKGLIQIIFRKNDDHYHLEVADNGRGLPKNFDIDDPIQHSLGLSLVKTLCRQLHGKLEVRNDNGATFILKFGG